MQSLAGAASRAGDLCVPTGPNSLHCVDDRSRVIFTEFVFLQHENFAWSLRHMVLEEVKQFISQHPCCARPRTAGHAKKGIRFGHCCNLREEFLPLFHRTSETRQRTCAEDFKDVHEQNQPPCNSFFFLCLMLSFWLQSAWNSTRIPCTHGQGRDPMLDASSSFPPFTTAHRPTDGGCRGRLWRASKHFGSPTKTSS